MGALERTTVSLEHLTLYKPLRPGSVCGNYKDDMQYTVWT